MLKNNMRFLQYLTEIIYIYLPKFVKSLTKVREFLNVRLGDAFQTRKRLRLFSKSLFPKNRLTQRL